MATVPGDSSNVTPMMPKWAEPTMADFLQAAHIVNEKGRLAMVKPLSEQQVMAPQPLFPQTRLEHEEHEEERNILRPQPPRGVEVKPKDL